MMSYTWCRIRHVLTYRINLILVGNTLSLNSMTTINFSLRNSTQQLYQYVILNHYHHHDNMDIDHHLLIYWFRVYKIVTSPSDNVLISLGTSGIFTAPALTLNTDGCNDQGSVNFVTNTIGSLREYTFTYPSWSCIRILTIRIESVSISPCNAGTYYLTLYNNIPVTFYLNVTRTTSKYMDAW